MKLKYYFHIHHEILVEALTEPLKNRIKYIKENKPEDEIELRLRLIKPVKGKLPAEFIKASQAWVKAYQAWGKARQAANKADQAWDKANQAWDKASQAWDKANQAWDKASQAWDKANQAWGKASQAWDKANQAWGKAYQAANKADQAWVEAYQAANKAEQARDKVLAENTPALLKLHKKECGCGWNGKTIFTKENGLKK